MSMTPLFGKRQITRQDRLNSYGFPVWFRRLVYLLISGKELQ
jgi:hypothetical protein